MTTALRPFLAQIATDPEKLAAFLADPDGTARAAGLSEEDRIALRGSDPDSIHARLFASETDPRDPVPPPPTQIPEPGEPEPTPPPVPPPPTQVPSQEPMPTQVPPLPEPEPEPETEPTRVPSPPTHVPAPTADDPGA